MFFDVLANDTFLSGRIADLEKEICGHKVENFQKKCTSVARVPPGATLLKYILYDDFAKTNISCLGTKTCSINEVSI